MARLISLINFTDKLAEDLAAVCAPLGCEIRRHDAADQIPAHAAAAFVCGDRAGWLENICQIRSIHDRMFLVIATHRPDHEKWLDALEAGANDYCCTPVESDQFAWLLRRHLERRPAAAMSMA